MAVARWTAGIGLLLGLLALAGCDRYPRDPEGTLARVQGGTLRAGLAHNPPWAVAGPGDAVGGREGALVEALARKLDAKVQWQVDGQDALFERLARFELDLVVGGVTADTPWKSHVALTRPYLTHPGEHGERHHVLALPPGENAWLMRVERFLVREATP